ncbi:MAG: hypothetical protein ABI439_13015 [Rhodospirillales bacterium]
MAADDSLAFASCEKLALLRIPHHSAIGLSKDVTRTNYGGKIGEQYVAAVLSGEGTLRVQLHDMPRPSYRDIRYVCLVDAENKAIFFHWENKQTGPGK